MTIQTLLIANRGEIAVRIAQTASGLGIRTVAIHTADDANSPHIRACDSSVQIPGTGPRGYLDAKAVVQAAVDTSCDAIHPGYGFLSENSDFADLTAKAGLIFVGPDSDTLSRFGDKIAAIDLAKQCDVPTIPGLPIVQSAQDLTTFWGGLPEGSAIMIKAASGGGGRGMRIVRSADDIEVALQACRAEAKQAFGDDTLYAEQLVLNARHIEVQVIGDGTGAVLHLGERECTLQRRNQKLVEIAPSPSLDDDTRALLCNAALRMAQAVNYRGLCTFEFLLSVDTGLPYFIEANPRIQVEHTVTEEIYGLDLVEIQLGIAAGSTLAELDLLDARPAPRGFAIQCRVTLEDIDDSGTLRPASGVLTRYEPPTGPGLRVDGFAHGGYKVHTGFDPLLAKVITRSLGPDFVAAIRKADSALERFAVEGVATNIPFLRALLNRPDVQANDVSTALVEREMTSISVAQAPYRTEPIDVAQATTNTKFDLDPDQTGITAPLQGTVFEIPVNEGDSVTAGQTIAVLEALKMEHLVIAPQSGTIAKLPISVGETLDVGQLVAALVPSEDATSDTHAQEVEDPNILRPDLQELNHRLSMGQDEARPEQVAKRKSRGKSTARENLSRLTNPETFDEYGALTVAAQRRRRKLDDLIANTTGDGIITGFGDVNADLFDPDKTRCALAIYDYMVLAGTQGVYNHAKQDRLFALARDAQTPLILFAEGGGGRPGDSDTAAVTGLDVPTFATFASLADKVPLIGVASGRCFAGNAALLGCCDVIIATEDSNIGMAGPAMIEGGGLGRFKPEEIGPIGVQTENGVVDIRVPDEEAGAEAAKTYLSYLQGPLSDWTAPDPINLRTKIPANRKRAHDVRDVIEGLADTGSVLELRPDFGVGIRTAFIRIEGRSYGVMANNAMHLGGAIDGPAALKAARFMDLCEKYRLPILSLCDTPGFIVGPDAEKTGLVRDVCQMFLSAAKLTVPVFGVVLRKGYGLGAMAMVGGGFHENAFTISWPTGEFGGMGLEGAVQLGFRKELDAIDDPEQKQALFDKLLAKFYEHGKALSIGAVFEIDAVIDPAETRRWVANGARRMRLT